MASTPLTPSPLLPAAGISEPAGAQRIRNALDGLRLFAVLLVIALLSTFVDLKSLIKMDPSRPES